MDDGSTDNTKELFQEWIRSDNKFCIRYYKVKNSGKQRAINKAVYMAEGESFVPEAVVWNQIAINGYKIRWFKDVVYICKYLNDGLTKGAWNLLKKNPIGYAEYFNHKLKYTKGFKDRYHVECQEIVCSILEKHPKYIFKSNDMFLKILALLIGIYLYIRRLYQLKKYS